MDNQNRSISLRIKNLYFWTYSLSILFSLVVAWVLLEELEEATLEIDRQSEVEHFLNRHETDQIVQIRSAVLTLTYLPANTSPLENLPIIFKDLPIPYEDEVELLGKEYMVIIDSIPGGTYYIAKDMTIFSKQEDILFYTLISLGVLAIIMAYGFSILISRMISRPIQQLTADIRNINQGEPTTYLPIGYKDQELNEVSVILNRYLVSIDEMVVRERAMITMASHELRTPVSVILGAAEIIEHRQQVNDDDRITLRRIISSANTMAENIDVLLSLVRKKKAVDQKETFSAISLCHDIVSELSCLDPAAENRVSIAAGDNDPITANKSMTRMLLKNLISNALNHNQGVITITLTKRYLEVRDQGISQKADLIENAPKIERSTGLGLYIVTLICEHLGWQFELNTSAGSETQARVVL